MNGYVSFAALQIGSPAHKGGVYGISWSPDGKQLLSCSGDKTCAIWDIETMQRTTLFNMGNAVENQQVGCCFVINKYVYSTLTIEKLNFCNVFFIKRTPKRRPPVRPLYVCVTESFHVVFDDIEKFPFLFIA